MNNTIMEEERMYKCHNCGEGLKLKEIQEYNGDFYCVECSDELVRECEYCHEEFIPEDREWGSTICANCFYAFEKFGNDELLEAICVDFGCNPEDVEHLHGELYSINGIEYYILTEDEANEKVTEYIKDSLWAFNPNFLANMTDLPEVVFKVLSEHARSDWETNEAIEALIEKTCGMDEFVEEAIMADGRGHFLDSYDGSEIELYADGETYYCYRS